MANPFLYRLNGLTDLGDVLRGGKFRNDVLERFHLAHLVGELVDQDDAVVSVCEVAGDHFILIVPKVVGSTPTHTTFDGRSRDGANRQEWMEHPDGSMAVGWVVDDLPTPEILERRSGANGHLTTDASKCVWAVPVGKSAKGNETFDRDFVFDLAGAGVDQLRSRSSDRLFEIAGELWELMQVEDCDFNRMFPLVVEAMGVNYCVGPIEVNAFQKMGKPIFNGTAILSFAHGVTDWDLYEEFQKKIAESKADQVGD